MRSAVLHIRRISPPSCAKTRPMGLRSLAVVEVEQAAEAFATVNGPDADLRGGGVNELVGDALVWTLCVVMFHELSNYGAEVPLADRTIRARHSDLADSTKRSA